MNQTRLKLPEYAHPVSIEQDDEIDLLAVVRTVWRGRALIFGFLLIATAIGLYSAYVRAVPIYQATSTIALENQQQSFVDLPGALSDLSHWDDATIQTEMAVLGSRNLLAKLVAALSLTQDPDFNWTLNPPQEGFWQVQVRGLLERLGASVPDAEPDTLPEENAIVERIITQLQGLISVNNPAYSYILKITAETTDAAKSVEIANMLAELYIEDQLEVKFEKTRRATVWLSERVAELQIDVEASAQNLKDFRTNSDLISEGGIFALDIQAKDLRDRLNLLRQAQKAALEQRLFLLDAMETGSLQQVADMANDVTLTRLLPRASTGDNTALAAFQTRFAQIVSRLESNLARDQGQEVAVSAALSRQQETLAQQTNDFVKLEQLEREAEASRLVYEYFLSRLKEASVQEGIHQSDARILSPAIEPGGSVGPRRSRILAQAAMLGLMLGAAVVLVREMLQNTARTPEDLEQLTGLSVMGQIPNIAQRGGAKVVDYLARKPASAAAEAVRNLRTSLFLSNVESPPRVVLITSAIPGEGKTTCAIALAQNTAGLGKSVLLIEADIRRRAFRKVLKIPTEVGLAAVLSGKTDLKSTVFHLEKIGVDVLVGDKCAVNPGDLFSSATFAEFILGAREVYDVIVIDAPPVLVVPDARIISQCVDAVLFIVGWDKTKKVQVTDALGLLQSVDSNVVGVVLSNISPKGMKRYGYGQRYGAYAPKFAKRYYKS